MNRLTKDLNTPHDDTTYADVVKDCVDRENIVLTKLKHYEDFEDEIRIDFGILLKAHKNGIYATSKMFKTIDFIEPDNIFNISFYYNAIDVRNYHLLYFSDYGKTWALTKEELEVE